MQHGRCIDRGHGMCWSCETRCFRNEECKDSPFELDPRVQKFRWFAFMPSLFEANTKPRSLRKSRKSRQTIVAWHNFIIFPIQTKLFNQSYNLPERFHLDRLTVQKLKRIASSLEFPGLPLLHLTCLSFTVSPRGDRTWILCKLK
jgi:hypothetical protein